MDNEKNLENITSPLSSSSASSSSSTSTTTTPYILNGEFYEILSQEGEGVTVRCRKCPGENIYKGSVKSTGNFHMHIKRKHSELLPRVHEMKLKSFTERKVKMPQRRQQFYNNNGRKIINEKYSTKLTSINQVQSKKKNLQVEPIDYRKNPKMLNNEMIFTQIHNYIPTPSYPINTNIQPTNQNDLLITSSQPPPAHQNSYEYIKKENNFLQDETSKDKKIQIFTENYDENSNQIVSNNSTLVNHAQNLLSIQNLQQQQRPLQIISNSPPMPLITTPATAVHSIPGHDVLLRVENHLKGIEREMRLRNQIESNRIYLELAKFKFLHPNFTLQN